MKYKTSLFDDLRSMFCNIKLRNCITINCFKSLHLIVFRSSVFCFFTGTAREAAKEFVQKKIQEEKTKSAEWQIEELMSKKLLKDSLALCRYMKNVNEY